MNKKRICKRISAVALALVIILTSLNLTSFVSLADTGNPQTEDSSEQNSTFNNEIGDETNTTDENNIADVPDNIEEPEDSSEIPLDITPEQVEKHDFESIVAEAEAEQAYRDSVEYVDNTIVFSVLSYRQKGEKAVYLKSSSPICSKYNLKNVSFILETKKTDVAQKDGYIAYQMFYMASVNTNDIWRLVDEMLADTDVLTAEPDFIWEKSDINDMTEISAETLATEVESCGWSYTDLDCMNIWNNHISGHAPGEGVVVAVIDTGVDYNHIDLKQNIWVNSGEIPNNGVDDDENGYVDDIHGINLIDPAKQGDPMDDMGHGTHVAGIIAMTAGNGGGVGIAYGSKIMAVKAGQASGYFASTDIAKAIMYAATNGADVINMSFGGTGKSTLVEAALADAFGSCVLIASAGNDGMPTLDCPILPHEDIYPAGYSYVLGVMACDDGGNKAGFSNWDYKKYANCEYEMIAPGVNVFSALPGNRYAKWSGTSMAAPMVSAAAAIVRREYRDTNKYSSRFIMGQLCEATKDKVNYVEYGVLRVYSKLNINDSLMNTPKPSISVSDIHFFDSKSISESNNPDGVVQAGETIDLGFVVTNRWGIAKDIVVEVDALSIAGIPNPYITFLNNRAVFDDEVGTFASINNGFVYDNDMLVGVDNPIRLKVSDDAPNDLLVTINFTVKGKNGMDESDPNYYGVFGEKKYAYTFNVQRGTYLRGTINEDMTLTADKLWIVDRPVLIPEGVTVNVEPGTKIQFYSLEEGAYSELHKANINVGGTLNIDGTYNNPIEVFTMKSMNNFVVNIKKTQSGVINMNYIKIVNPNISITYGNHMSLVQTEEFVHELTYSGTDLEISDAKSIVEASDKISNSIFYGFNYLVSSSYSAPYVGTPNCSCVLFCHNYMSYGLNLYHPYRFVMSEKYENNVFLNNYNYYHVTNTDKVDLNKSSFASKNSAEGFTNNAILNPIDYSLWFRIIALNNTNLKNNYWGTTNETLISKMIIDQEDNSSYGVADYSEYLSTESDLTSIYPFVTEAYVTDLENNRLVEVANGQTAQIHVKFNRDMSQDEAYAPMVSFGPAEPYTDYVVNGVWISAREWVGTIQIEPFINQGTEYLRIKDAAAADDLWLTTGTDAARFSFDITKTSAEALTLQGSGESNSNYLNWVQDDYDTLAGYNLYRSTEYDKDIPAEEQNFVKINSTLIPNDVKEYTDIDVEQGVDYYYYFTVVDTQFKESPASNVVKCTPLDEESPVIVSKAISSQTEGIEVPVSATVTDNVKVESVTLYYKSENESDWKSQIMRNVTGDSYKAVIPAYDVIEGTIQYYITASDGSNTTCAGTRDLPNVFSVLAFVDVESITLDKSTEEVTIGESTSIAATVFPENASDKTILWTSSDETIAIVDENGNVEAKGVGEATVTATSAKGDVAAICNITVTPVYVTDLSIEPEEKTVNIGDTFKISTDILPEEATIKELTFESDNVGVATVDSTGKVSAKEIGEANITVKTKDGSNIVKTCVVTVAPISVQAVSLNVLNKTLKVGKSFTLTASVYPENATNKNVTWTSDHPDVAKVENGKVTALKGGKATITVETTDGGKKAICNVTVNSIPVTEVGLSQQEMTLNVGETGTIEATITPENATNKNLEWKSGNRNIATVSEGTITAVAPGKTTISCTTTDGSEITKVCEVKVYEKKTKPAKPETVSVGATEVTLKSIEGAVYSKDKTNWQESATFSGLTENTKYTFYVKLKAEGYYLESDVSDGLTVTTASTVIPVTSIELSDTELELLVDEDSLLAVTVKPDNATNKQIEYRSTNSAVATVDENGAIHAKSTGKTFIIVRTLDGSNIIEMCTVCVYAKYELTEEIKAKRVTESSITLEAVDGCEYRIGDGAWTDNTIFTGLNLDTEYSFSMRKKANGYYLASDPVTTTIKTNAHALVKTKEVAATCAKVGKKEFWTCSECGKKFYDAQGSKEITDEDTLVIPMTAHEWGEWTISQEPSLEHPGQRERSCNNCHKMETEEVQPIHVEAVSLDTLNKTVSIGDTFNLTAIVYPENATDKTVIWTSSATDVATVVNGKVTAISGGKVTITAETKDGRKKAICNVIVNIIPVTKVTLNKEELILNAGLSETLKATIAPKTATEKILEWNSANKSIATVSSGKVTGISAGRTTVSCTTTDGSNITEVCEVKVYEKKPKPAKPQAIFVGGKEVSLKSIDGALYSLDKKNWTENPTFSNLTPNTEYTFYVKLKAEGYYLESDISDGLTLKTPSYEIPVQELELSEDVIEMMVGGDAQLAVTVKPEEASNKRLEYRSTNATIATVDENGKITAKSIGKTFIVCKALDGSNVTEICTISVFDQYALAAEIAIKSVTESAITIQPVDGCEYRIGEGEWSDTSVFEGLNANEEYTVSMRRKANGYHLASESVSVKVKTNPHTLVKTEEIPSTCKEVGRRAFWTCSVCGKRFLDEQGVNVVTSEEELIIPIKEHEWGEWVTTWEPASDHPGIKERSCKNCGDKETEEIPPTGRTVVNLFVDVSEGDWFVNAVQYVYDHNIMAGSGDYFNPNKAITREQFTQVLYNHQGKPFVGIDNPFADVDTNQWYANSVLWAKENGIAGGKGEGRFGVGQDITREELAVMLYKYAVFNQYSTVYDGAAVDGFSDVGDVSGWAREAMNWAVSQGVMSGKGGRLDPKGKATRAECASMIKNLLTKNGY